ncbi:undecaprenyl/decaprenyl-phosphate alpha-N-acetylglucosaminyl 1-phosphate transferase [Chitinophaga horti]|uniref:Undecaprenyl/decaprenyl-phosphate alpha-N-acetylglucosaminyl 1-phosphate transferase n=1 Tax=Chitinophaga horti TaxID=2920382 RepID=A0ABY6J4B0_9BACT|nr:MraY family glycosyltransferase [Chitinophaga horti]UYQ93134.1 undecaprenyl/decaprenyl-phosphate alpha-N-acetylglucosaminyl 1-phosphate transferase [Chitinophaga horti]
MENVIIATVLSFVITYFSVPILIRVADLKHLYDEPDERKAHKHRIPALGGVGFFSGFLISIAVCIPTQSASPLQYFMAAYFIIFMVGLKDDLVGLSPLKKVIGQMAASFAIIYLGNLQIHNASGLFGIYDMSPHLSSLLTYFTVLVIINAFNLIDGVDGQAGSIGMLVSAILGAYFLHVGETVYAVMGFSLAAGLAGFLIYNISPAKIFMGDTGSLLIGAVNAILIIKFIEVGGNPASKMPVGSVPAVAFGILIVPLFDTLRVFSIRMMRGRSPFSADRNHIHHYLLALDLNHRQTTMTTVLANAGFIVMVFALQGMGTTSLLIFELGLATGLTYTLYLLKKKRAEKLVRVAAEAAAAATAEVAHVSSKAKILRVSTDGVLENK